MSNYGLKVSLPGYDVKTATPEQCAVHSGYASPKIKLNQAEPHADHFTYTFTSTPSAGSTTNILTINHGYGYRPMALVHFVYNGNTGTLPLQFDGVGYRVIRTRSTSTQFIIEFRSEVGDPGGSLIGTSVSLRYYIFAEVGA